ncbi:MAG: ATP-binding protein [Candidatus Cloacimonadaceae bacterium]|jgi:two-component system nitrogen regulation sensor histidine kinase NtrY|nr:HAMP domain-containing protein [Candidatus Cloacimonadota bacterium]MDY0128129.1 ATP-binding protein [Candidatus Cloacimonadaceae bacterium]MCB5254315.1 HAMP domain-containing protein [Candidatus Cloacimonadota bacterium]MCK9178495.1 ATP-binding protein [Candidatus Cloacimonadota bacterium]MCK9243157.1 ATP-binding protein [Candidatus Cloacimonadota bacterium]
MPKFGMRTRIILLFIIVSIGGLILLNNVFQNKHDSIHDSLAKMELSSQLREIKLHSKQDSLKAEALMKDFNSTKAVVNIALGNSRIVTSVVLLLIIVISTTVFIFAICRISKPLKELKHATEQIRQGDFSVHLPETGISEMRELKNSFNVMSRELETTQTRLLVAEKEMIWKDLSRILAHEIKNPLTPIQLVVQRLEERLESDCEGIKELLPESISIISQEIENLQLLAQDFSNYAKVNQPNFEELNPALSIREIVKSYVQNYQIKLELSDKLVIRFDKTHFYQVITNILQNAIDASETDNTIDIHLYKERSYAVLCIKDQGKGIESKDLPRIFEPYFSKKSKGTGLGLALVKRLCDANNAIIRVKSKPDEGSEFTLIMDDVAT